MFSFRFQRFAIDRSIKLLLLLLLFLTSVWYMIWRQIILSVSTPRRHRGGVEVQLHSFLTLELVGDEAGGAWSWSGCCGEVKNLLSLLWSEHRVIHPVAVSWYWLSCLGVKWGPLIQARYKKPVVHPTAELLWCEHEELWSKLTYTTTRPCKLHTVVEQQFDCVR